MTEIMGLTDLFSPTGHRPALPSPLSRKRLSPSLVSFPFKSVRCSSSKSDFHGRRLAGLDRRSTRSSSAHALSVQMGLQIGKSMKWWEKGLQINMKEIESAQDLSDALLNAGNRLVVVDFFSPGCGGCRALHPKIAEMNPDVMFLHVNYEEHKSMCYSLNVHVLPFFRFYRGAQGRICSFSCTNATDPDSRLIIEPTLMDAVSDLIN